MTVVCMWLDSNLSYIKAGPFGIGRREDTSFLPIPESIGGRTYSAAQNTTTLIERHTNAILVGEPTGCSPNFVWEETPFKLPYSKLLANVSDLYWQSGWPMDYRTWTPPAIYTPSSFEAFCAGRDLALEAILAYSEYLSS
jgi:hypothetical protein